MSYLFPLQLNTSVKGLPVRAYEAMYEAMGQVRDHEVMYETNGPSTKP